MARRLKNKIELLESLFDEKLHAKMIDQKKRRFTRKALLGAIAVALYHPHAEFNTSYQILNFISDVDLHLINWRSEYVWTDSKVEFSKFIVVEKIEICGFSAVPLI